VIDLIGGADGSNRRHSLVRATLYQLS